MPANNQTATGQHTGDVVLRHSLQSGDGAITQATGTVFITKGSAAALTIADPVSRIAHDGGDDNARLLIISETAFAHTLSNAAGSGFNGGGAGSDVATFGGAKGDNIELVARGGRWYIVGTRNVTLG